MSKQVSFLLGISFVLTIILLSIPSTYAAHSVSFTFDGSITEGLDAPTDIAVDSNGRIIVTNLDNSSVQIYDATGNLVDTITDADGSGSGFGLGVFSSPYNVAVDSEDKIYVSDGDNSRVQVFYPNGVFAFSLDVETNARGVTIDSKDRIIIAETLGTQQIQIYNSAGNYEDTITDEIVGGIWDVAVDSKDRIIAIERKHNIFHIYDSDGTHVKSVTTVGGKNQRGITTDSLDRIFITDQTNHQIHIYNSTGDFVTTESYDDKDFQGITTDCNDRIIAADIFTDRILFFEFSIHEQEETSDNCPSVSNTSDSCSSDCTPPSLESLEFNNTSNWLTAKNQTFNIGDKQIMKFVYYEDEGIDDITDVIMGFGLPSKKSPIGTSEIRLQINTFNGNFTSLEIEGNDKLFLNSTTVKVDKVQCGFFDCLEYTLEFIWAEIPFDNYFLIIASDDHRNKTYDSSQNPFTVIGETLNEQPTLEIYNRYTSTKQDGYSFNITRTDKITDMWIDEKGEEWCDLGNDRFELVP